MKVTPLDMRQAQFRAKMRGYDPDEVTHFLSEAAYELEHAVREIDRLRQDLVRSETTLNEHREREAGLRNTLLTAQRLADQIKDNAEQEAKTLIREAEGRADLILQKAQHRLVEVERDIHEMKLRRRDVEGQLEASISSLTYALEFMRAQDQAERDEKTLLHRPKAAESSTPALRPVEPRPRVAAEARPQVAVAAGPQVVPPVAQVAEKVG